jgi:hypothetical protein
VCACSSCLRQADHQALVPPLQASAQQAARLAAYVLRELQPHVAAVLNAQAQEVRRSVGQLRQPLAACWWLQHACAPLGGHTR